MREFVSFCVKPIKKSPKPSTVSQQINLIPMYVYKLFSTALQSDTGTMLFNKVLFCCGIIQPDL